MELATPNIRDSIYRALLAAMPLSDAHRKKLRVRGLSDDAIDAGGYATVRKVGGLYLPDEADGMTLSIPMYLSVPGFGLDDDGKFGLIPQPRGFLIPQRNLDGQIIALKVRLDHPGSGGKCRAVTSNIKKYKLDGPSPGSPCHVPLGTPKRADRVIAAEGELKADVVFALTGEPTLSFPGAGQWRAVLPVLEAMGCRTVCLAFDADHQSKKTVAGPMRDCIRGLREHFAVDVLLWDEAHGKGLDDLLVAGHVPRTLTDDLALAHIEDVCRRMGVDDRPARRETSVPQEQRERAETNGKSSASTKYPREVIDRWKNETNLAGFIADLTGQRAAKSMVCPFCQKKGKLGVYLSSKGEQRFQCFRCGGRGDHFEFLELAFGMKFGEAYDRYVAGPLLEDEFQDMNTSECEHNSENVSLTLGSEENPKPRVSETFSDKRPLFPVRLSHCPRRNPVWCSDRNEATKAALIGTFCNQWDCGCCGPMRAAEHFDRITQHVEKHGQPVYLWETEPMDEKEWKALTKKMNRKMKKAEKGDNHGYVRILQVDDDGIDKWLIIATVPPHEDAKKRKKISEELESALARVPAFRDGRMISYSSSWGPIEEMPDEPKYQRIGTISDVKAAREHAELWGLSVSVRELKAGNYAMNATGFSDDPELATQQKNDFKDEVRFHPLQDGYENAAKLFHLMSSIARGEPRGIIYPHRHEKGSRVCTACGKVVVKGIHWCWQLGPSDALVVADRVVGDDGGKQDQGQGSQLVLFGVEGDKGLV